jgi:hypothetical protein
MISRRTLSSAIRCRRNLISQSRSRLPNDTTTYYVLR